MCQEEPLHNNRNVIAAKLWLIGRAYSAQIERKAGKPKENDSLYATVATTIANSAIDQWLKNISSINRVDLTNLTAILAVHYRLTALLQQCTKLNRRSFVSKYLHFHNPLAFFIFDSRANEEIRERLKSQRFSLPSTCTEADKDYANFVLRCIAFRDSNAARMDLTPRQLDQELLGY